MKKLLLMVSVIFLLSAGCNSASQSIKQQATVANQSANAPQFQAMTIEDLVSNKSYRNILVDVQGTLSQKADYNDQTTHHFFLKIKGVSADVMIMPKDNILGSFNIGDIVEVKGAVGSLDCTAADLQKLCGQFNLPATSLPVIVPIPSQNNDNGIKIVKKISETVK